MSTPFPRLFSPIRVGQLTLRNRIVSTPHASGYVRDALHDEREIFYQAEKARGGVGFQFMGATNVVRTHGYLNLMANVDERIIPIYRQIAAAVHRFEGRIGAQLSHFGAMGNASLQAAPLVGPSPVANEAERQTPQVLEREELAEIAQAFATAARRCREGDLDAVILQLGHGYLLTSFLSPRYNQRTDEYGGSTENRVRYPLEVLQAMRREVGRDFTLGVRISGSELIEGGIDLAEAQRIAQLLDASGLVDWIDVSQGNDAHLVSKATHYGGLYIAPGAFVPLAAAIREVVSVPVVAVGRILTPQQAEQVLEEGQADLVAMTRALIADPHLPRKAQEGRLDDIRVCVGANEGCLGRIFVGDPITCVQNPLIGREQEWAELPPAPRPRHVLVVGGGPAGLEAARVAAARGHRVTLLERAGALGGQVPLAARIPGRAEFAGITRWLIGQVRKLPVEVRLETEATPELVEALQPEVVVLATGSRPASLQVPGGELPHVVDARAVLAGAVEVGEHVLVLDGEGYLSGLGVADFLLGQGKRVQLLTRALYPGDHVDVITLPLALKRLAEQRCVFTPTSWVRRIEPGQVIAYHTLAGWEFAIAPVETVVLALPALPEDGLYRALKGRPGRYELHRIGDCLSPRHIDSAIYEGQRIGRLV